MSNVIKLPLNKIWKDARDQRAALYNNPAWYSPHYWVRDRIEAEWERLTLILRQQENNSGVGNRSKYQLPR